MNERQKMFVAEYLVDFNATQSAIRAGYSENSARAIGSALLTHADVSRALREAVKERIDRLGINADDILLRALKVYERAMQAEAVMKWDPESGEFVESGEYVFDSKGATKALELIGKLLGAFMKEKPGDGEQRPFIIQINNNPRGQISPPPGVQIIDVTPQDVSLSPATLPAPALRINTQPNEKP